MKELCKNISYANWDKKYKVRYKGSIYTIEKDMCQWLINGKPVEKDTIDNPVYLFERFMRRSRAIHRYNIRVINRREKLFNRALIFFCFILPLLIAIYNSVDVNFSVTWK